MLCCEFTHCVHTFVCFWVGYMWCDKDCQEYKKNITQWVERSLHFIPLKEWWKLTLNKLPSTFNYETMEVKRKQKLEGKIKRKVTKWLAGNCEYVCVCVWEREYVCEKAKFRMPVRFNLLTSHSQYRKMYTQCERKGRKHNEKKNQFYLINFSNRAFKIPKPIFGEFSHPSK